MPSKLLWWTHTDPSQCKTTHCYYHTLLHHVIPDYFHADSKPDCDIPTMELNLGSRDTQSQQSVIVCDRFQDSVFEPLFFIIVDFLG